MKPEIATKIFHFINTYSREKGLPSPGRNFRRDKKANVFFLPAALTYQGIYAEYKHCVDKHFWIGYTTFCKFWKKYVSNVQFLSQRTDLCDHCKIMQFKLGMMKPEKKLTMMIDWQKHIKWAMDERDFYKESIQIAKKELSRVQKEGGPIVTPALPNSKSCIQHYSFDYAQQVMIPSSSQQEVNILVQK